MKVYIKNMVCKGSKLSVLYVLKRLRFNYRSLELGEIDFAEDLSSDEIIKLDNELSRYGLEVMHGKSKLISRIRDVVLDLVENRIILETSLSKYVSNSVGYNYSYLNKYFVRVTGLPIEEYYIEKKNDTVVWNEPNWSDVLKSGVN